MAVFDQVRHPMRFAIAASTVSGLLVVLFTAAADWALGSGASGRSLMPWALAGLGWAVAVTALVVLARTRRSQPQRVFLIVSAYSQKHWVAELIHDLHRNLAQRGYDLVLKLPDRDYSGRDQVRLLEQIVRRGREYAGGFIMANEVGGTGQELARLCAQAQAPVVFVDSEPFQNGETYPPGTAFAGYDDKKIGEAAAQWMAGYLHRECVKHPVVLVINGGHFPQREQAFRDLLASMVAGIQFIDACAGFDRVEAREVARTHLRRLSVSGKKLDAVFCTNDEMALGVTDALQFAGEPWVKDIAVAGVDGTPQARALIDAGPGPLRATVVQDSFKVAETAVGLLEKLIRKEPVPGRITLIPEVRARD
jgi:ABC-type sugar transport system substrate-binding protein